jgi:hypothetical protein
MRLTPLFLIALITLLATSLPGQEGPCGVPPGSIRFSDTFYRAEARLYQANEGISGEFATVTSDLLPIRGSLGASQAVTKSENLTVTQAREYVQAEHAAHGAQILAECGYRLCELARATSTLPGPSIALLAEICGAALPSTNAPAIATSSVRPRVDTVIFASAPTQARTLTITNPFPATLDVALLIEGGTTAGSDSLVHVNQSTVTIPSKSAAKISVTLDRPPRDAIVTPSIVVQASDGTILGQTQYNLIQDPALLLPPADIGAGMLYPNARIKVDTNTAPFVAEHPGPYVPPVAEQGPSMNHPSLGTAAHATYSAQYERLAPRPNHVYASLTISANVGGVCGTANTGGAGGITPRWTTVLSLPGITARHQWNVTIGTDIRHVPHDAANGTCTIAIDTQTRSINENGIGNETFRLGSGEHELQFSCTGANPYYGCYGHANKINAHDEDLHYRITIDANRTDIVPTQTAATIPDSRPSPEGVTSSVSAGEVLWRHFNDALQERGLTLSDASANRLREYVESGARKIGNDEAKIAHAKADLATLADYLKQEVGGPGIVHESNTAAALNRWCPRYPWC